MSTSGKECVNLLSRRQGKPRLNLKEPGGGPILDRYRPRAFDGKGESLMKRARSMVWLIPLVLALAAGGCSSKAGDPPKADLVVNSLEDIAVPPAGTVTPRSAAERSCSRSSARSTRP